MDTAVAFIIFNRPDLTAQVFETIRRARPKRLLVIADGPRPDRPGEADRCRDARQVIDRVDWDCHVERNYSDINLGCRERVSSGLNWVFSTVDRAIVLEDDCVPDASFFPYCEELLERYQDDERIMHIGGNNFQFGNIRTPYSYYFSHHVHIWGWASWSRAWKHYDVNIRLWPEFKESGFLTSIYRNEWQRQRLSKILDDTHSGLIDTWDYQWMFACLSQNGLAIIPAVNLVSNIGFRADATHTTTANRMAEVPVASIGLLRHPAIVRQHEIADHFTSMELFGGKEYLDEQSLRRRLRKKLGRAKSIISRALRGGSPIATSTL